MHLVRRLVPWATALFLLACGGRQTTLIEDTTLQKNGDASPKVAEGDALFAGREDKGKTLAAISAWEEAGRIDPTRPDIQLKLAYAYNFLANAHLRWDDDTEGQKGAYDQGVIAAERAIKLLSPAFATQIKNGKDWETAISKADRRAVPAMYWYASNLHSWATLDGFTTVLSMRDRVTALIERCGQIDETFWYAAPHRHLGVYATKIPFPKGDLEGSRKHFERALELAPKFAETRVLFAETWATRAGDRELYKKLLEEVLAMPDDVLPDLVPETKNAKRRAQQLLSEIDDRF